MKIKKKNYTAYLVHLLITGWMGAVLWFIVRLCPRTTYDGITVYTMGDDEQCYHSLIRAMELLKREDPRYYQFFCRHIKEVVLSHTGLNAYSPWPKILISDLRGKECDNAASILIHEAVHGFLHRKGFMYHRWSAARHEKICTYAQKRFLKRMYLKNHPDDAEARQYFRQLDDHYAKRLQAQWWTIRSKIINVRRRWSRVKHGRME